MKTRKPIAMMAVLGIAWMILPAEGRPDGAPAAGTPAVAVGNRMPCAGILRFLNSDVLNTVFLGAETDGALRLLDADTATAFTVDRAGVVELQLSARPSGAPAIGGRHMVELANGDRLAGNISAMNNTVLRLDTGYAGSLEIRRDMVRRIVNQAVLDDSVVYRGPSGMVGWCAIPSVPFNGWECRDNVFRPTRPDSGTIGRDMRLPDVASIEFDLAWREAPMLFMGIYVTCIDRGPTMGNGYTLTMNGARWSLNSRVPGGQPPTGGDADVSRFLDRQQAHIAILADLPGKQMTVTVDGELVKQWALPGDVASYGRSLYFSLGHMVVGRPEKDSLRLANILVRRWNGRLPAPPSETGDSITLADGGTVHGVLKSMTGDKAIMEAGGSETNLPMSAVEQVDFARKQTDAVPRRANDVLVRLRDDGRLTLAPSKADDQSLFGDAAACGPVTVALDSILRLQFRPGDTPSGRAVRAGAPSAGNGPQAKP